MDNVKLSIEVGHSVLHNMSLGPGWSWYMYVAKMHAQGLGNFQPSFQTLIRHDQE